MEAPTFSPGIRIGGACNSFVINGTIRFLRSSTHSRSGQTIEIPDCHDLISHDSASEHRSDAGIENLVPLDASEGRQRMNPRGSFAGDFPHLNASY
jgi:hypothetical protein